MRASRSSGSVGERGGNEPLYPDNNINTLADENDTTGGIDNQYINIPNRATKELG